MKRLVLFAFFVLAALAVRAEQVPFKEESPATQGNLDRVYSLIEAHRHTGEDGTQRIGRQVAIGTVQTSDGTVSSASYTAFSNSLTLSFAPQRSGLFRVYGVFNVSYSNDVQAFGLKIVASSGSPTVIFAQEAAADATAVGSAMTASAYTVFRLESGTSYTFVLHGKCQNAAHTLTLKGTTGSGHVLIAEELE